MLPSARLYPCHGAQPRWQGCQTCLSMGGGAGCPAVWWGIASCLGWKPAGCSIPIGSHRLLLKLINIYFRTWFLMHILSNDTPAESNTQTVQEEKTKLWHSNKPGNKCQANQWQAHGYTNFVMLAVYISNAVSSLQEREQPIQWAMNLLFHPGRNQDPRLERISLMLVWMGRYWSRRGGRKLHASQGRNLERYLQNTTFLKKFGLNMV